MDAGERRGTRPFTRAKILALLLALATFLLYQPTLHHQFVNYDDTDYVTTNAHVLKGLSWSNVAWSLTGVEAANWHPLTWISHMADVQFFGLNPLGHHFTSVLLHVVNVLLLFLLLQKATGCVLRSAAVAALFAAHPLNVEAVAWVAERKSVLCTTLILLTLWAYGWYVRRPGTARYLVVAGVFTLALMAKPMAVTLPLAMLLLDYWPLKRLQDGSDFGAFRRLFAEKILLLTLAGGSAWVTMVSQRTAGALGSALVLPLRWRITNAIYSYAVYLGEGIWPSKLVVFYPHPEGSLALWKVLVSVLLLLVITVLVWRYRERRYLLTGWLWFLGNMVPTIGLVQVGRQGMGDRYAYIPFWGLFVIVVWLGTELAQRVRLSSPAVALITLGILAGYVVVAEAQIGYWQDSYTLFSHAVEASPNNGIAENNLGAALVERRRPDLAMPHFQAAVRLVPGLGTAHYNLATMLQQQGRVDEAQAEYQAALKCTVDPKEAAQAHNNLGVLLMAKDRRDEALAEFTVALGMNPDKYNSLVGRGILECQGGNFNPAVADLSRALKLNPSPLAYYWLGRAYAGQGDFEAAAGAYEAALKLAPGMTEAQQQLDAISSKVRK